MIGLSPSVAARYGHPLATGLRSTIPRAHLEHRYRFAPHARPRERLTWLFSLAMAAAAVWAAAQVLAAFTPLDDALRSQLVRWKNLLGVVFFICAALSARSSLRPTRIATHGLLFPVYAAFNLASRGDPPVSIIALYLVWWWGFFVAVPAAAHGALAHRRLLAAILVGAAVPTLAGVIVGLHSGQIYWWDHQRLVFSFSNPIYFAYSGLILFVGSVFFITSGVASRTLKLIGAAVALASLAVMVGAHARNCLLFCAVFIFCYLLLRRASWRPLGILTMAIVAGLTVLIVASDKGRLDALTSGRLRLWQATIEQNVGTISPSEFLFGVGRFQQDIPRSHDLVFSEARFERPHTDNAYLDLFLSLGAVGVVLFVYPLLLVARALLGAGRAEQRTRGTVPSDVRVAIAALFGLLAQGVFISNIPSLGNVVNISLMTLIMGVWSARAHMGGRTSLGNAVRRPLTDRPDIR